MLVPLLILLPANARAAVRRGKLRSSIHRELVDDLRRQAPLAALGQWYAHDFCPGEASVQTTLRTLAQHHLGPFRNDTFVLADRAPVCEQEPAAGASGSAGGAAPTRTTWNLSGRLPDLVLAMNAPRELCGLLLVLEVESPGPGRSKVTLRFTARPPDGGDARQRSVELKFAGSGRFPRTVWVHGVVGEIRIQVDSGVTAFQVSSVTLLTPAGARPARGTPDRVQ